MQEVKNPKCKRCGREFDNLYPEVVHEGRTEIACVDWCANCNVIAMSATLREGSAYWVQGGRPPWQGEAKDKHEDTSKGKV